MSCSVKISGKGWAGSQRRISSLPEETVPGYSQVSTNSTGLSSSTSTPTLLLSQQGQFANRVGQFSRSNSKTLATKKGEDTVKLLKYIDDNVIGKNGTFFGPFGRRKVVYCDYTASGRSLQFLEEYIVKEVLPCLGDTRASTSICSLQSSLFRHEARDIVRHAVGAGEQDAVLFTGHGTDDALRTLLRHLDLPRRPTVVFVGPFEHHANLRPWREHGSKLIRIAETKEGYLDLNDLESKLIEERSSDVTMVGCFSAASCITGVLADDIATTLLLRQYGALSVWDYTSAAPFIQMDMNPHLPGVGETAVHKDAIIFSGHKFMGGAQSPGVLVVKKSLLKDDIVSQDMRDLHRHFRDPELREESGTAGVIESIRCGLAVQLKENVTPQAIVARQDKICKQVLAHLRTIPELTLLGSGSHNVKRLPVFSFMVRHPRGTFLHYNFVCAILNDVFGIQARGGCACAGRYAHDLMGIDTDLARKYEAVLVERNPNSNGEESDTEVLRPGFARLSLPYFMSEAELAFVLEALKMVATEGWKLLPQYVLNPDTGEWRHHTNSVFKERKWLGSIRYTDGKMMASERRVSAAGGVFPQSYSDCLQTARNIFNRARKMAHRYPLQIDRSVSFSDEAESLRWFILPGEAQDLLLGNSQKVKHELPFDPVIRKTPVNPGGSQGHTNQIIRRLNSDIPRSGNPPLSVQASPRHHSLPALSITQSGINKVLDDSFDCSTTVTDSPNDDIPIKSTKIIEQRSCPAVVYSGASSRPETPSPPVKFALGEAVTSSMILGTTPAGARLMAGEHSMSANSNYSRFGRTRCNSLGSTAGGKTPPVPIPLGSQTVNNLRVSNSSGTISLKNYRHCSCSSRVDLSCCLEFDGSTNSPTISSPVSSATSSPTSSSSVSPYPYVYPQLNSHHHRHHHHHHHCHNQQQQQQQQQKQQQQHNQSGNHVEASPKLGRSSPVLSSFSQSSEDDLRAYLKEVTKELATEIKSEIREVISKVDDALLSDNNTSDVGTPQHHYQKTSSTNNEKPHRDDSFSASEIAEYLMEFSKEMASEVKSEIRCMVNQVDGLGRFSPDLHSTASAGSTGYGTPEHRLPASPLTTHKITKTTKVTDLQQQQESKMSSECSSDETVIYVVGPRVTATTTTTTTTPKPVDPNHERAKTSDDEEESINKKSCKRLGNTVASIGVKTLPEIYSAVNSVSSQDSGINLSFNESDIRPTELGRSSSSSSSSGSSSAESISTTNIRKIKNSVTTTRKRGRNERLPDDLSEDDYNELMREEDGLSSEDDRDQTKINLEKEKIENYGPQWHSPSKHLWKPTVEAIHEYDMIRDKDRILVCLPASAMGAGIATGNYCLALLHSLHQYQFHAKSKNIDFEIGAVTIDAGSSYDPLESMSYLKTLQIPYFYEEAEEQTALINPNINTPDSQSSTEFPVKSCDVCRRPGINIRQRLYSVAKRYGYNVLALAHNLDDLAEGFLSSLFYTGKLKTMKAHYYVKKHELRVVRPFVYVRERSLKHFTVERNLPNLRIHCESCDEAASQKLQRHREIMAQQEKTYPRLYWSMRNALKPLIFARSPVTQTTSHQRQRHKLKSKTSPSHPPLNFLATSLEVADSEETDGEEVL